MTDRDELAALLRSWEVPFGSDDGNITIGPGFGGEAGKYLSSPKVDGYQFWCTFEFTLDGDFTKVGVWE